MKQWKNVFVISGVYIATIIGAGFASGQEILSYFVVYGKRSLWGLLIVTLMFTVCCALVLMRVYFDNLHSFKDYMLCVSGRRMWVFMEVCASLFMLAGFCSMAAGSGSLFQSQFGWNYLCGVGVMLALCTVVFLFDLKGILAVNSLLAPIMCAGLVVLGVSVFVFRDVAAFAWQAINKLTHNWVVSAILYGAYNLLTSIVILCETRPLLKNGLTGLWVGIVGGGVLGLVLLVIWAAIKLYYGKILLGEIPLLVIVSRQGRAVEFIYSTILYLSMFTTAVSCGYGFLGRLKDSLGIGRNLAIIFLLAVGLPATLLGFSGIVQNIYSAFGFLGLPLVAMVLVDGARLICGK